MPTFLEVEDLTPFAEINPTKAQAMIDDATAMGLLAAPCLGTEPTTLTDEQQLAIKAILRGAILRWVESGVGAVQSENIGNYGYTLDTRQPRKAMFWPSELVQLQGICGGVGSGAFSLDTTPTGALSGHQDYCSINFGATYCSCGYVLTAGLYYP